MGGDKEAVHQKSSKTVKGSETQEQILQGKDPQNSLPEYRGYLEPGTQEIRTHISNGELHFHDDKLDLKVAVPIADWYAGWSKLSTFREQIWTYLDQQQGTLVKVVTGKDRLGQLEARIEVEQLFSDGIKPGKTFEALSRYTTFDSLAKSTGK